MSRPEPPTYPPDPHITRDLAPVIERDATGSTILQPIVPELLDAGGRLRMGVVATIVDIVCGETAIREVLPKWVATSVLSVHAAELPGSGTLRAKPRLLRHGRTTLVLEVDLDLVESGRSLGLANVGFSILPGRSELQARAIWAEEPEARTEFSSPGSGLEKPLLEKLGVVFGEAQPAETRLDVGPYIINTLGAMQGGVVAILIDAAAEHFASREIGGPARVASLEIHYLKLARGGPIRASVRTLGRFGSHNEGLSLRVELHDEGAENVLTTVATVVVDCS